jgi:hypothetical protein
MCLGSLGNLRQGVRMTTTTMVGFDEKQTSLVNKWSVTKTYGRKTARGERRKCHMRMNALYTPSLQVELQSNTRA